MDYSKHPCSHNVEKIQSKLTGSKLILGEKEDKVV